VDARRPVQPQVGRRRTAPAISDFLSIPRIPFAASLFDTALQFGFLELNPQSNDSRLLKRRSLEFRECA
jgi:hypothetical protein